jgi:hypothetical protein
MLPFPVNLGESYSVRIHLSMDFVRRIKPLGREAAGARTGDTTQPLALLFLFGRLYIQTLIYIFFVFIIENHMKQGVFRL